MKDSIDCSITIASNEYIELLKKTLTGSIYEQSSWEYLEYLTAKRPNILRQPRKYADYLIKSLFLKLFQNQQVFLLQKRQFDAKARNEGRDWPFIGYTMIGDMRLENIRYCVDDVLKNQISGDFIETGVWRGGATIFMRALLKIYNVTDRRVWVADSFEGLPTPADKNDGVDLSSENKLKVSLEEVKSNFARFDLLDGQVEFLKGWFSDTLPSAQIDKLAILRLDGDMYHSTMDALISLYHKVSKGGYVIVDDYMSWKSCRKAVDDFLEKNSIHAQIERIDFDAVFWKVE